MTLEVTLKLDPKLVWRVWGAAENRGVSQSEFVAEALAAALGGRPGPSGDSPVKRKILELHSEGFTDAEIALRVEVVKQYVGTVRRKHGLKANGRRSA